MAIERIKILFRCISVGEETLKITPIARINMTGKGTMDIFLEDERITRNSVAGTVACEDFFAVITREEFIIFNLEGQNTGNVPRNDAGQMVMALDDMFVCLKGNVLTGFGPDGKVKAKNTLTDEAVSEISSWST